METGRYDRRCWGQGGSGVGWVSHGYDVDEIHILHGVVHVVQLAKVGQHRLAEGLLAELAEVQHPVGIFHLYLHLTNLLFRILHRPAERED